MTKIRIIVKRIFTNLIHLGALQVPSFQSLPKEMNLKVNTGEVVPCKLYKVCHTRGIPYYREIEE